MKSYYLPIFILAASIYGCGESTPPKTFTPYELQGLIVPGRLSDAKNSGFTDCKVDYYAYTCQRAGNKEVFGVEPRAISVSLNGAENLQENSSSLSTGDVRAIPPEKLSYRRVDIELRPDVYDQACLKKKAQTEENGSIECIKKKGTQAFVASLKEAGWIESQWKSYKNFVHDGIPIEISVQPYKHQVTIRPETLEAIKNQLASTAQAQSEEQKKQAQADAVLREMKGEK